MVYNKGLVLLPDPSYPHIGGDPPAPSGTGTLLRLLATQKAQTRSRPSEDDHDLINTLLASSDGRCVQAPGEYSGCHNETSLLCIPRSRGRLQPSIPTETGFRGWLRLSTLHPIVPAIATRVWP